MSPGNGRVRPMNRCRLHIHYSGRVQGVGFRYRVKTLTTGYEVIGTVRNLADGRVELIVEGMKEELAEFQKAITDSELGSFIRGEHVNWKTATGEFKGFQIVG